MVWSRRLLRVVAALALLAGVAVAPARADNGPGHGDVLTATPTWSPVGVTAGAFVDTPAFLIGQVHLRSAQTLHLCAYTVTDKDGVAKGVRVMAVLTSLGNDLIAVANDDVTVSEDDSWFKYLPHQWGYTLRLYVVLPRIDGALAVALDSSAPGHLLVHDGGDHLSGRVVAENGHGAAPWWAATWKGQPVQSVTAAWGTDATGYCESHTPPDPLPHLPS